MSWIRSRKAQETLDLLGRLSVVCARLGGPTARDLNSLVQAGRYEELIDFTPDYSEMSQDDAVYSRQILGFFQKLEDIDLGKEKDVTAARRFAESEVMCHGTNVLLKSCRSTPSLRGRSVHVVLHHAQRKIAEILGDVPALDVLQPSFGPGANTNVNAALANPRAKLSAALVCSHELLPTVSEFLSETPMWSSLHSVLETEESWIVPVTVDCGKLIFVPKNAKTSRSIVVEPLLNSFFQKGVGSYIRNRLLSRSGIDLRDQSRNQRLACQGSMNNGFATVDLSMASDCLSTELVWELLPYDWADLLSRLKTGSVRLPEGLADRIVSEISGVCPSHSGLAAYDTNLRELRLEKFSSMGNGFTFELESLIFYGLAFGVCHSMQIPTGDVSVYGDDIIVPRVAYSRLSEVLSHCGFRVNPDKSFSDGPFRESCGADYLNGFDIRPFYQKSLISERTLYTMHNWFIRHCERELAAAVFQECNPHLVLFGPDGYGDGHLIGSFTLRQSRKARRAGWCGGVFDTYALKSRRYKLPMKGDAVLPTYSVYTRSGERDATDPDVIRGSRGYAKVSIYTHAVSIFRD